MTPAEFVEESKSFKSGYIYVVSGPDISLVMDLLYQAQTAIQTTGRDAVVYDFKCRPSGDPIPGGCTVYAEQGISPTRRWLGDKHIQSLLWERYSLLIQELSDEGNPLVMLIGNTFDPEDQFQNPSPISLTVDVVMDLMNLKNTATVIAAAGKSPTMGFSRELFQFITGIYFYDTKASEVTFIKEQIRQRPDIIGTAQAIQVLSPLASQTFERGKRLKVFWNSYDLPRGSDMKIDLYKSSSLYQTLAHTTPDDGNFVWKLPLSFITGNDFYVRVTSLSPLYTVHGDSALFSIL